MSSERRPISSTSPEASKARLASLSGQPHGHAQCIAGVHHVAVGRAAWLQQELDVTQLRFQQFATHPNLHRRAGVGARLAGQGRDLAVFDPAHRFVEARPQPVVAPQLQAAKRQLKTAALVVGDPVPGRFKHHRAGFIVNDAQRTADVAARPGDKTPWRNSAPVVPERGGSPTRAG